MDPSQKARLAIIDHLLQEAGGQEFNKNFNVKVSIISLTERGDNWHAICSTDAHTDKNYAVSYNSTHGTTLVETFSKSDSVRYWDIPPDDSAPAVPTTEYYGA